MNARLILKATVATLLIPGTVTVLIPYFVFFQPRAIDCHNLSVTAVIAAIAGLMGVAMLVHCICGFAFHGEGTLAPLDPPKVLVVRGLYKYTRNPMYLAVVIILLSESLLFQSLSLLLYTVVVWCGFHLLVTFYEEPTLRSQFGKFYEDYCEVVPRWWMSRRGFTPVA
jgi:protein-S-isoprenylcysteine O-methyltransferase Ste14